MLTSQISRIDSDKKISDIFRGNRRFEKRSSVIFGQILITAQPLKKNRDEVRMVYSELAEFI